jgi:hypothetical protein
VAGTVVAAAEVVVAAVVDMVVGAAVEVEATAAGVAAT